MDASKGKEQWYSKLFRVTNSAMCFILAYVAFTYLSWFITATSGKLFKLDSFVYYYGVKFIMNGHAWDKYKVGIIYSAGPLFVFFLGMVSMFLYKQAQGAKSMLTVFLFWCYVIGTCSLVSSGIIAILGAYKYTTPFYHQLAVVFSWWRVPVFLIYLLNIPLLMLFLYFSINFAKPVLTFSYSFSKVNKLSRRRKYFFETALVPFVVGAAACSAITLMRNLPAYVNLPVFAVQMLVIGVALFIGWYALKYIEVVKSEITRFKSFQTPNFVFLFFLIALWAFVYLSFKGIYLG